MFLLPKAADVPNASTASGSKSLAKLAISVSYAFCSTIAATSPDAADFFNALNDVYSLSHCSLKIGKLDLEIKFLKWL